MASAAFLRQLKHTCDIQRFTASDVDDYNQPTGSWANVATGVACLLQQKRGLVTTGWRERITETTVMFRDVMFCDYGTNIREGDKVTNIKHAGTVLNVREDTGGNAVTFKVVEVIDAAGQRHHYEVKLKVIET